MERSGHQHQNKNHTNLHVKKYRGVGMLSRSINDDSSDWGQFLVFQWLQTLCLGVASAKKRLNGIAFTFRIPPALYVASIL